MTGGSRGIGAAVSLRLAESGTDVYAVYREREDAAAQLADSAAKRQLRGEIRPLKADVTDAQAWGDAIRKVAEESAGPHVLVHSAGGPSDGLLLRSSDEDVRRALSWNLETAIRCSRSVLGPMLKARWGRIVLISSVVATSGNAGQSLYAAAKGGVEAFTRALAREVGRKGITVNAVAPGFIDTDMTADLNERQRSAAVAATVSGRAGTPEEVAHAVAYLCDERAGYATGTVLHVNGGMYM